MDCPLIGYQLNMSGKRLSRLTTLLLACGAIAVGLTACGSDNGDSGDSGTSGTDVAAGATGKQGNSGKQAGSGKKNSGKQGGQITPGKKAPDSAGDRDKNAPDDVISDKPGGAKPVNP
jgi:hypothetical protein